MARSIKALAEILRERREEERKKEEKKREGERGDKQKIAKGMNILNRLT